MVGFVACAFPIVTRCSFVIKLAIFGRFSSSCPIFTLFPFSRRRRDKNFNLLSRCLLAHRIQLRDKSTYSLG
jgi:hypothetical protein